MRAARGRVRADGLLLPAAGGLVVGVRFVPYFLGGGDGVGLSDDAREMLGVDDLRAARDGTAARSMICAAHRRRPIDM